MTLNDWIWLDFTDAATRNGFSDWLEEQGIIKQVEDHWEAGYIDGKLMRATTRSKVCKQYCKYARISARNKALANHNTFVF